MKKLILLIVFLWAICSVFAQDFTISFQPKVSGTPIDSVQAINLRTNQVVKLSGGESLLLLKTPTGINSLQNNPENGTIYPNPTNEDATLCFSTNKGQQVEIRLYNANGQLLKQNRYYLEQGAHRFELKFPSAGIYFISLLKSIESASFKLVYTGKTIQNSSIWYAGSEKLKSQISDANQLKRAITNNTLSYTEGDFIQYSVSSGVNTTIITETPTVSKAIDVEFVNCIDKDNKSYKVVKIGTQWWMAENLAYLPAVSPPIEASAIAPFYYIYDYQGTNVASAKNNPTYATYGVLYNWTAALAACPPGWHLPSDAEWTTLTTFLGGEGVAGGKLKETGTTHWVSSNTGTTNEYGFAALPAGDRSYHGSFHSIGSYGYWWSSTEDTANRAWGRGVKHDNGSVERNYYYKEDGLGVRYVRD